jgi:rhodanese-related sulfurtransferase
MKTISIHDLQEMMDNDPNAQFIDVRTASEFRNEHINAFKNIPLHTLTSDSFNPQDNLVIICQRGNRSQKACALLKDSVSNLTHVAGGVSEWSTYYSTVKQESHGVSIMRQVQIVVGLFVLIGAILSQKVSPNFIWLSAFFGAGLLFAGVTNTCALAAVLTRMPWNK